MIGARPGEGKPRGSGWLALSPDGERLAIAFEPGNPLDERGAHACVVEIGETP